jgi:endonuclease G
MKKLMVGIAILALASFANISYAWTQRQPFPVQQCQVHAPYGFPQTTNVQPLCQEAYLVGYDQNAKLPKFVTYELLPQNALGCVARTNAFVSNQFVPNGPRPDDYAGTGYDKGHAAPDGDLSWNQQVEYESFLMTNMFPQHGSLNRGIWKLLETNVRGWAVQLNQSFTVYVGAIYNLNNKKIGNGVVVPHGYYKIVINNATKEVAGWEFPHIAPYINLGNDLTKFRTPINEIMKESGVQFAFPQNAIEIMPGKEWLINYGALTNAKRQKCGSSATD